MDRSSTAHGGLPVLPLLLFLLIPTAAGCRTLLGPDDVHPPASDGPDADDAPVGDDGGDAPSAPPRRACDLRLQDCPDKKGCYPDEAVSGDTVCLPRGSGGPLSPCMQQGDCDARLFCLLSPGDPAGRVCAEICRAGAEPSGCQPGQTCTALPGYEVGYCRF